MSTVRIRALVGLVLVVALVAACVAPVAPAGSATSGAADSGEPSVINVYTDGDTNISDWYQNIIVPAFEAQYPQYTVNFVNARGVGEGTKSIADRALAALETGDDPQADVLDFNVLGYPEFVEAGLWLEMNEENVPNSANVVDAARTSPMHMAYRGSQVLLAYDSEKVAEDEAPDTFAQLVEWIKAHPGQFVYCRPDQGGSGGNFVTRAIYEVTGKDPTLFKPGEEDPELIAQFDDAWALLRDIHPAIYDNGAYPAGNNPVLQLLANGSVSMISAWSDQALQAISTGALPETIKLKQFEDLPFPGGYAYLAIPKNSANVEGALAFIDFLLNEEMQTSVVQEIGGFPAVGWDTLPADLQSDFTDVITENVPAWPGGAYDAARNKGWYEQVATNLEPEE